MTENTIRNAAKHYDVELVLATCNLISARLHATNKGFIQEPLPESGRVMNITLYAVALLAKIVARNYRYAGCVKPKSIDVLRLVNNCTTIDAPLDKRPMGTEWMVQTMVRLTSQQFAFQEELFHLIPRHLLLFGKDHVQNHDFDIEALARTVWGLSIEDYITIGFAFYAVSLEFPVFDDTHFQQSDADSIRQCCVPENLRAFLARAGATLATFRQFCFAEEKENPGLGAFGFNPLIDRPVLILRNRNYCVPVPALAVLAATRGLYYDLLDSLEDEWRRKFLTWFGYAFEAYVGRLMTSSFGTENVWHEPRYPSGRGEMRGPDWVARIGKSVFAVECRSGRLNKRAKTQADYDEVSSLLRRHVLETLLKLPSKIEDIASGAAAIDVGENRDYFPIVVTYEPLHPHGMFVAMIRGALASQNLSDMEFELMSVEDLEYWLAWNQHGDIVEVLREKWADLETRDLDMRSYLRRRALDAGVERLRHPLLEREFDRFWHDAVPELWARRNTRPSTEGGNLVDFTT